METWPATLPLPDAIRWQPQDVNLRSEMEIGGARVRGLSTEVFNTIGQQWTMTGAQLDTFREFFHDDIAHGRDWFTMGVYDGSSYVSSTVRFIGTFQADYEYVDGIRVTAQLELRGDLV